MRPRKIEAAIASVCWQRWMSLTWSFMRHAPELTKATITVFTDIDCGYCRKLHQDVPELNRLGVAVRYLAFPRAGIGSDSYDKAVSVWCADDQQKALTKAKAGKDIEMKTCVNPVAEQYGLVDAFGVTGTPAIFYEDGTLQAGGTCPLSRCLFDLG